MVKKNVALIASGLSALLVTLIHMFLWWFLPMDANKGLLLSLLTGIFVFIIAYGGMVSGKVLK